MRKVLRPTGLVPEGHEEAVAESLRLAFDTGVRAPLEIEDCADLAGQRAECLLDAADLLGRGLLFPFEQDDMTEDPGRKGIAASGGFVTHGRSPLRPARHAGRHSVPIPGSTVPRRAETITGGGGIATDRANRLP